MQLCSNSHTKWWQNQRLQIANGTAAAQIQGKKTQATIWVYGHKKKQHAMTQVIDGYDLAIMRRNSSSTLLEQ